MRLTPSGAFPPDFDLPMPLSAFTSLPDAALDRLLLAYRLPALPPLSYCQSGDQRERSRSRETGYVVYVTERDGHPSERERTWVTAREARHGRVRMLLEFLGCGAST